MPLSTGGKLRDCRKDQSGDPRRPNYLSRLKDFAIGKNYLPLQINPCSLSRRQLHVMCLNMSGQFGQKYALWLYVKRHDIVRFY